VWLYSCFGNDLTYRFPLIVEALRRQVILLQRRVSGRSNSRMGIACSWSCCIAGFHRSSRRSRSSGPRLSCVGIEPASVRYWRSKSGSFGGRPEIDAELRALIRRISAKNPLWRAPRIHGELLKLGFEVAQSSVATLARHAWAFLFARIGLRERRLTRMEHHSTAPTRRSDTAARHLTPAPMRSRRECPARFRSKNLTACRLIWCAHTNQKRGIALLITDDRTTCSITRAGPARSNRHV
jgi:hypothetical protein